MWAQYVEQKIGGSDQDEVGDKSKETAPDSKLQQGRPDSLSTLGDLLAAEVKKQGKLETMRIPLNQFPAPSSASLEAMVKLLKGMGSAVPVIVSDQGGKCRAATGAVVAALIKEAQLEMEFAKMRGIVPDDIIDDLRSKKLHPEPPPRGKDANALMLLSSQLLWTSLAPSRRPRRPSSRWIGSLTRLGWRTSGKTLSWTRCILTLLGTSGEMS